MTFSDKDVDWLADLLASVAAQEILPRFRRLGADDIRRKTSAIDLVTDADEHAERAIVRELSARYPGALVLGEEACSADASLLNGLAQADLAFVIDPVDGTFNFASGVPLFGIMLAVVAGGETVAGIIHDPIGGGWSIGVSGAGAFVRSADGTRERMRAAAPAPIREMIGSISWQFVPEPLRSTLARNHARCLSHFGYRCAAHEYRLLACGHAHFAIYNKLLPWDHLAGSLLHAEAGGYSARFDGSAYRPEHVDGGLLVVPDRESWNELRSELWAV